MRSLKFWELKGVLLLLSTITACSSQPSAAQLTKELETVASWTATAHMVGDAWVKRSVPTVYAQQTLQTTQEELHKEAKTIAEVAPVQDRMKAQKQLQDVEQTVEQITKAIGQDNRASVTQSLQELSRQEQVLAQLVEAVGEQP